MNEWIFFNLIIIIVCFFLSLAIDYINKLYLSKNKTRSWLWSMLLFMIGVVFWLFGVFLESGFIAVSFSLVLMAHIHYYLGFNSVLAEKIRQKSFGVIILWGVFIIVSSVFYMVPQKVMAWLHWVGLMIVDIAMIIELLKGVKSRYFIFKIPGLISAFISLFVVVFRILSLKSQDTIITEVVDNTWLWLMVSIGCVFIVINIVSMNMAYVLILFRKRKKEKDEICQIITHDLNHLISEMCMELNSVQKDANLKDERIERLLTATNVMRDSLYNVLRWMLNDFGVQIGNLSKISLKYAVNKVIEDLKLNIDRKRIQIVFRNELDFEVSINILVFDAIVRNLLENAIKYSKTEGVVFIDFGLKEKNIFLTIEDMGIGMNKQKLRQLNYDEVDFGIVGPYGETGNGLGISIIKKMISANNGTMLFSSDYGVGTKVIVSLPSDDL
ncbi:hypothetical protein DF185_09415 [Marinifilum breve]|uniref:histidine kinase n=1 Tax=Marinifilum breve TaxID=2184082 RepID=A0A2V3ZZC0_9BACT|nr:sensor histidine kinase [Marinifilum breve]PXY01676.1 hypothetical protein DF185_09415 [Marinifilum breve]